MSTKIEQLQAITRLYKLETGKKEVDTNELAAFAMLRGVVPPQPKTAKELLAAQFSHALSIEHRRDPATGYSYRANHALRKMQNGNQMTFWVDIDEATRKQMHLSLTSRRQQMIGDGVQLKIDELVWNNKNVNEQPIQMVMDFTDDVEERLNAPEFENAA